MKTTTKILFLFACTFFLSVNLTFAQSKAESIEKLTKMYGEYGRFNGSVLVSQDGKVIYKGGVGQANMEWEIPNEADTKHRLGSITKQFTAMLIVQLAEQGKLKLDAPISTYLPDYPKEYAKQITTHHLLTHTSGIPNYTSFGDFFDDKSRDPYSPEDFIKIFMDRKLEFTPGDRFNYSNSGYFLLGIIVEKLTDMTYEEALHKMIFEPLDMQNTGFDNHADILKKRATGYQKSGNSYENSSYLDMSIPYAAGSMYSTTEDLFLWDQALYTEKIISKKYLDLCFKKHIPTTIEHYGYGWQLADLPVGSTDEKLFTISHGGGINGFNTNITRFPSDNSCVILLNNTGGAPLQKMTIAISGILQGKPYDLPKKSIAEVLEKVVNEKGIEEGISTFERIKKSDEYELDETSINTLGYTLMRSDKMEAAAAIFKINVESFPNSSNVFDSYGEVLMAQGKNDLSIKSYRKSVELNPANRNAVEMLKKMGDNVEDLEKKVIVSDEILKSYIGKYELSPSFILTVSKKGKQMRVVATGQSQLKIHPISETVFYVEGVEAQLTFGKSADGKVESVTLLQNGRASKGMKME